MMERKEIGIFVANPTGIAYEEIARAQGSEEPLELDQELGLDPDLAVDLPLASIASAEESFLDRAAAKVAAQAASDALALAAVTSELPGASSAARALDAASILAERIRAEGKGWLEALSPEDRKLADLLVEESTLPLAEPAAVPDEPLSAKLADGEAPAESAISELRTRGDLALAEAQACVEALLFASERPVTIRRIREALSGEEGGEAPLPLVQEALTSLSDRLAKPESGVELVEVSGGYQLRTKLGHEWVTRRLARTQAQRLSSGAFETLAVIAYQQPVLKEQIDRVRGVDSSHFIRILLDRELAQMVGRSDLPGRPILYGTTPLFLEIFGLKDLTALPPLSELEGMVPASLASGEEDPKLVELRKMVTAMREDDAGIRFDAKEDEDLLREIRERVSGIATTTPTLVARDEAERAALASPAPNPPPFPGRASPIDAPN